MKLVLNLESLCCAFSSVRVLPSLAASPSYSFLAKTGIWFQAQLGITRTTQPHFVYHRRVIDDVTSELWKMDVA